MSDSKPETAPVKPAAPNPMKQIPQSPVPLSPTTREDGKRMISEKRGR